MQVKSGKKWRSSSSTELENPEKTRPGRAVLEEEGTGAKQSRPDVDSKRHWVATASEAIVNTPSGLEDWSQKEEERWAARERNHQWSHREGSSSRSQVAGHFEDPGRDMRVTAALPAC